MTRRYIRSLEHYEAQANARRKVYEGLEPRVIKPPRSEIRLYQIHQLKALADLEAKKPKLKVRKWAQAVDKALEWFHAQEYTELSYTEELWGSALNDIGFYDGKINWSGFCSQGDGASFTANIDLEKLIEFMCGEAIVKDCIDVKPNTDGKEEDFGPWVRNKVKWGDGPYPQRYRRMLWLVNNLDECKITRGSGRYYHENTCSTNISICGHSRKTKRIDAFVEEFAEAVESLRVDLCKAIYRSLEEDYQYQQSIENFVEAGECNNWWFHENGNYYGRDDD